MEMKKSLTSSLHNLRRRWKTVLVILLVAGTSFIGGGYANRVVVGLIQSIAGNRVLVPPPELQIVAAVWSIDGPKSLVTDVVLLVTTQSPVLTLKRYQVFVQVSCLDETILPPREFICSNGQTSIILPTNGAGLRRLRIILETPVNPELTEIHDLSFIVTDLGRIGPIPPTHFVGPTPAVVELTPGTSVRVTVRAVGVAGVAPEGHVVLTAKANHPGVRIVPAADPWLVTYGAPPQTQAVDGRTGFVMADSFFDVFADVDAQIGVSEASIAISDPTTGTEHDMAIFELGILCFNPQPEPPGGCL